MLSRPSLKACTGGGHETMAYEIGPTRQPGFTESSYRNEEGGGSMRPATEDPRLVESGGRRSAVSQSIPAKVVRGEPSRRGALPSTRMSVGGIPGEKPTQGPLSGRRQAGLHARLAARDFFRPPRISSEYLATMPRLMSGDGVRGRRTACSFPDDRPWRRIVRRSQDAQDPKMFKMPSGFDRRGGGPRSRRRGRPQGCEDSQDPEDPGA